MPRVETIRTFLLETAQDLVTEAQKLIAPGATARELAAAEELNALIEHTLKVVEEIGSQST